MPLATFGDYQLLHVIGTSGSGVYFRARRHGEACVLQVGDPTRTAQPSFRERWESRVEVALERSVRGCAEVTGAGWRGDLPWVAMAADGWTLGEILRCSAATEIAVDRAMIVHVLAQAARALEGLHGAIVPVLHGRVAADHIMIEEDGSAVLLGLGFSSADLLRGWPLPDDPEALASVAPELLSRGVIDQRIDVYGLGLSLLSSVAGANPFAGGSIDEVREAILAGLEVDPEDPELGDGLGPLLARALALDPAARAERAEELADALDRSLRRLGGAPDPMDWTLLLDELFPDGPDGHHTPPDLIGRPAVRRVLPAILSHTSVGVGAARTEPRPAPTPPPPAASARPPAVPLAQRLAEATGAARLPNPPLPAAPPRSEGRAPRAAPPPTPSALGTRALSQRPSGLVPEPAGPRLDAMRAPREGPPDPDLPPLPADAPALPEPLLPPAETGFIAALDPDALAPLTSSSHEGVEARMSVGRAAQVAPAAPAELQLTAPEPLAEDQIPTELPAKLEVPPPPVPAPRAPEAPAPAPRTPWLLVLGLPILIGAGVGAWLAAREEEPPPRPAPRPTEPEPTPEAAPAPAAATSALQSFDIEQSDAEVRIHGQVLPDATAATDSVSGGSPGRRARHLIRLPSAVSRVGHKRIPIDSPLVTAAVIQREGADLTISVDVAPPETAAANFVVEGDRFTLTITTAP